MATVSTHILDTSRGRPAVGVQVVLAAADGAEVARDSTDRDGRVAALGAELPPGTYRLHLDVAAYHAEFGQRSFYPEVVIAFVVEADEHYHVPLLLNPYGYSTYRGS